MQEKTGQYGFQWNTKEEVWDKVEEEINEFKEVVKIQDKNKMEEELGDVLFSIINYARYEGINPETALERVNKKFKKRFEYIESNSERPLKDLTLEEMDALWNKAKSLESSLG
jgi:XTP/dITP diphosphohydrolase